MKKLLLLIILYFSIHPLNARHIKGGFFNYTYLGAGTNNPSYLRYRITLTVYMDCDATGDQIDDPINFTIFDGNTNRQLFNPSVRIKERYLLQKTKDEQCISGDQRECYYKIIIYELDNYELPVSANGYIFSYQRCCRLENMDNVINSGDVGNTYTIKIPGTSSVVLNANHNSSPDFPVNDTIVVCGGSYFNLPFTATDKDGDSLVYSLCSAYTGGAPPPGQAAPNPAEPPPYFSVPYSSVYDGSSPMGDGVSINPITGLISGVAPNIIRTGEYVITVCVSEYRNGIYFADSRKELHIKVKDCSPLAATLKPQYITCGGFTMSFTNMSFNPAGTDYRWTFGDQLTGASNISIQATPTHTFSDTGIYTVKLHVSTGGGLCADSASSRIKVYPGFFPGFITTSPLCTGEPIQFRDTTSTKYGTVTGWRWNFGNPAVINDTSRLQHPIYTYPSATTYKTTLIVGNTFGCVDTVSSDIIISSPAPVSIYPKDTLICSIDTLQLTATGNGSMSWSPNYMIRNTAAPDPFVSPDVPTKYFVSLTDVNGCKNKDSVFVDVRTFISVSTISDTTICKGDSITLKTTSEALQFSWSPNTDITSSGAKSPIVFPAATTSYKVIANLGKCQDQDQVKVTVVPYPVHLPLKDTGICSGTASLNLTVSGGLNYSWSPDTYLSSSTISNPVVLNPAKTIQYIVAVTDILGCPKPTYDTINVKVIDPIIANAGPRDTSIVLGEPLQLVGTGGELYNWSPSTGLSAPDVSNPVAVITENVQYVLTASTKNGCKGTDTISVKVYRVDPDLYVPSAFTPNNDGINDIFRPVLLGMKKLTYFNVYNRWGQMVFSTNQSGAGWDGNFGGNPQDSGTFVWKAKGTSYQGKELNKKGYVILIR